MGTVTGYTADKINELLANGVVNAEIDASNHLILTTRDGTSIDVGPAGGNTTIIGRQVGEPIFWLAPLTAPIPTGFLALEGGTASRTTYADLWALWGTTYGAGDGVNTFGLPDMRKKSPFGYDSTDPLFNAIGKTGGSPTHTLTAAEMQHQHEAPVGKTAANGGGTAYFPHNDSQYGMGSAQRTYVNYDNSGTPVGAALAIYPHLTSQIYGAGSASPHSIMPPYIVGRWLVKAAYTGAEIDPGTAHVHSATDITSGRLDPDRLPVLPDPVDVYPTADAWSVSSAAAVWTDIPGASREFTNLLRPLLVRCDVHAQGSSPNGSTYPAIGVAAVGALNAVPTSYPNGASFGRFTYVAFTLSTTVVPLHATKTLILPAGTTTLKLQQMRNDVNATPSLSYASLQMTPIRWL